MQRFLQDERFRRDELPKLIEEEKREALHVNSEIDFTIKPRETVKLVSWIWFHSLYHSGKLQIRFRRKWFCHTGIKIWLFKKKCCKNHIFGFYVHCNRSVNKHWFWDQLLTALTIFKNWKTNPNHLHLSNSFWILTFKLKMWGTYTLFFSAMVSGGNGLGVSTGTGYLHNHHQFLHQNNQKMLLHYLKSMSWTTTTQKQFLSVIILTSLYQLLHFRRHEIKKRLPPISLHQQLAHLI